MLQLNRDYIAAGSVFLAANFQKVVLPREVSAIPVILFCLVAVNLFSSSLLCLVMLNVNENNVLECLCSRIRKLLLCGIN